MVLVLLLSLGSSTLQKITAMFVFLSNLVSGSVPMMVRMARMWFGLEGHSLVMQWQVGNPRILADDCLLLFSAIYHMSAALSYIPVGKERRSEGLRGRAGGEKGGMRRSGGRGMRSRSSGRKGRRRRGNGKGRRMWRERRKCQQSIGLSHKIHESSINVGVQNCSDGYGRDITGGCSTPYEPRIDEPNSELFVWLIFIGFSSTCLFLLYLDFSVHSCFRGLNGQGQGLNAHGGQGLNEEGHNACGQDAVDQDVEEQVAVDQVVEEQDAGHNA
ncbi:hypothetical protein KSS87_003302 [Heliosperma pusillum]|nr:hypothetical protein KSS87_003302 [Heliosperma pusillum]